MNKKWALCICLALGLGIGLPAEDLKPIKITVFTGQNDTNPPADNKIYKLMKDKLGVTFEWDILVGQLDQKLGVMIASGDYPDILDIGGPKLIDAGACIPLEKLIDQYGPNLKKHYGPVWNKIKEKDGHIYCLPNWGVLQGRDAGTYYGDSALWMQKAVLKEFGYPKITTMDQYFDLIAKYKAKYPTIDGKPTIGFTILTYDYHDFCLINPPNFLAGNPNDGNGVVNKKTYDYNVFLNMDISKRWFKKLNEMNQKGLIDRECFVDNYDQYLAKLASGRVLGIHDQLWQFNSSMDSLRNAGNGVRTMAPLPIVFDSSVKPWYRNRSLPNLQRGYGISVKAQDPVRIIKFLDAQLSEDWQKTLQWGILNEDYQLDKKGVPYCTPEQRKQHDDKTWQVHNKANLWFSEAPKLEGTFSDGNPTSMGNVPGEYLATQKPEDVELFKAYKVSSYAEFMDPNPPENPVYFPAWQISPPDGSPAQFAWAKAQETYRKYLPRIIMSQPKDFDKQWNDYVTALGKTNLKTYEGFIHQGIMDRVKTWSNK